jgi:hypothetical protein
MILPPSALILQYSQNFVASRFTSLSPRGVLGGGPPAGLTPGRRGGLCVALDVHNLRIAMSV